MPRAALLLGAGIVLGAAGAVYIEALRTQVPHRDVSVVAPQVVSAPKPTTQREPDSNVVDALAVRPRGSAERAAFYAAVARSDARGIETLLIAARALLDRDTRLFALDALLARYAELDPSEAVAAAKELDVPAASLVPLYRAWVERSSAAALASLGALEDPKRTEVASGLLALVADDDALVARVITALPPLTSKQIYASSLAQLARRSPADALARAVKIADAAQRKAATRMVLSAWAQSDPRAVVDYLAGLDAEAGREAARDGVWQQIAMAAPELALERADTLPQEVRVSVQVTALQMLAQRDPKAALARLAQMPRGVGGRDGMLPMIARSFAARDPDGALAWARSLQPPEPGVMAAVVSSLTDPARAFDLASEIASPMEQQQALQQVASMAIMRDPASIGSLLERVLAMPNSAERQALVQTVINGLASSDPGKAAEWLIANPGQSPTVVTQVASAYARTDAARAASYSSRFSGDARVAWIRGVAGAYAQVDSRGALEWVEQLRGTPEYDDAAVAVLQSSSQQDPAAAVRLIDSISREDYQRTAITWVASFWANSDPAAAANWAANLRDPTQRTVAVQVVGSTWANQNTPAAKEWILSQPSGPARDGALVSLMSTTARLGAPDTALLADISTDQSRVAAVQSAAMTMAQRDVEGARAFVENNVTDPQQRERLLSVVSQFAARRVGVPAAQFGGMAFSSGAFPPIGPAGTTVLRAADGATVVNGVVSGSINGMRSVPTPTDAPVVRGTARP